MFILWTDENPNLFAWAENCSGDETLFQIELENLSYVATHNFQGSSSTIINWEQLEFKFHRVVYMVLCTNVLWKSGHRRQKISNRNNTISVWKCNGQNNAVKKCFTTVWIRILSVQKHRTETFGLEMINLHCFCLVQPLYRLFAPSAQQHLQPKKPQQLQPSPTFYMLLLKRQRLLIY